MHVTNFRITSSEFLTKRRVLTLNYEVSKRDVLVDSISAVFSPFRFAFTNPKVSWRTHKENLFVFVNGHTNFIRLCLKLNKRSINFLCGMLKEICCNVKARTQDFPARKSLLQKCPFSYWTHLIFILEKMPQLKYNSKLHQFKIQHTYLICCWHNICIEYSHHCPVLCLPQLLVNLTKEEEFDSPVTILQVTKRPDAELLPLVKHGILSIKESL